MMERSNTHAHTYTVKLLKRNLHPKVATFFVLFCADFQCIWHHLVALTLHILAPPPTCQIDRLLVELAVRNLLFHAPLLVLRPRAGRLVGSWRPQRGHHLLATQSLPLTLLRHLKPELVVHPEVARTHISVSDDSVWMEKEIPSWNSGSSIGLKWLLCTFFPH